MELFRWSFDPWVGLRQLRTEMEDAFGRFNRVAGLRAPNPPLNVFQDDDGVTIVADVPGVKSSDVAVEAEGDRLRLTVKRPAPEGIGDDQYHRRERLFGEFTRELRLPAGLDTDGVEAALAGGVLTVKLPKAEAAKPKKITVKAG